MLIPSAAPPKQSVSLSEDPRLAEAEEQVHLIRSVVEQGFSCVLIASGGLPDPKVLYINPAFAQATRCRSEEVVGQPLSALPSLARVRHRLLDGMREQERFLEEISTYSTAEGERWGEWRVGPVKDRRGQATHWLIIFRDITERKRLEREILEISDQERRRLGQDLHDGLCQHLAGIELQSQLLEQQLTRRAAAAAARAGEIARHVRDAISQTQLLARGLAPVTLELEGLDSALRELAANAEKMFGVACRAESGGRALALAKTSATPPFRIAQEAVSNAIKHGHARQIRIRLDWESRRAIMSVADDGGGFPPGEAVDKGMGRRIMQYRASMIGGSLVFENCPGGGARVICAFAVEPGGGTDEHTVSQG